MSAGPLLLPPIQRGCELVSEGFVTSNPPINLPRFGSLSFWAKSGHFGHSSQRTCAFWQKLGLSVRDLASCPRRSLSENTSRCTRTSTPGTWFNVRMRWEGHKMRTFEPNTTTIWYGTLHALESNTQFPKVEIMAAILITHDLIGAHTHMPWTGVTTTKSFRVDNNAATWKTVYTALYLLYLVPISRVQCHRKTK